jgi:caa(3)-type oxidase subunit IV
MSEHSHPTPGLYLVIFLSLVVGTCLTWGIAFKDLGVWNPVVALTIAVVKALLVILFRRIFLADDHDYHESERLSDADVFAAVVFFLA